MARMEQTEKAFFRLKDNSASGNGGKGNRPSAGDVVVDVSNCGDFLWINASGYADGENDDARLACLEYWRGELRLLVWADPDRDEPQVISLERRRTRAEDEVNEIIAAVERQEERRAEL